MSRWLPYLLWRGNRLCFRIAVPSELRAVAGFRELTQSLGAQGAREAEPLGLALAAAIKRHKKAQVAYGRTSYSILHEVVDAAIM